MATSQHRLNSILSDQKIPGSHFLSLSLSFSQYSEVLILFLSGKDATIYLERYINLDLKIYPDVLENIWIHSAFLYFFFLCQVIRLDDFVTQLCGYFFRQNHFITNNRVGTYNIPVQNPRIVKTLKL